jgi:hypothetical protein
MPTLYSFPKRYLPQQLSRSDTRKQVSAINRSKKLYSKGIYYTRPSVKSFHSKPSHHVDNAKQLYGVDNIFPSKELSRKTGCSVAGLKQIVRKGEGAYYSSGSRPNQTAQSWGMARLASAITAGKSAAVDFAILEKECNHGKRAYKLATKAVKKYGFGGRHKTRKRTIRM